MPESTPNIVPELLDLKEGEAYPSRIEEDWTIQLILNSIKGG